MLGKISSEKYLYYKYDELQILDEQIINFQVYYQLIFHEIFHVWGEEIKKEILRNHKIIFFNLFYLTI